MVHAVSFSVVYYIPELGYTTYLHRYSPLVTHGSTGKSSYRWKQPINSQLNFLTLKILFLLDKMDFHQWSRCTCMHIFFFFISLRLVQQNETNKVVSLSLVFNRSQKGKFHTLERSNNCKTWTRKAQVQSAIIKQRSRGKGQGHNTLIYWTPVSIICCLHVE